MDHHGRHGDAGVLDCVTDVEVPAERFSLVEVVFDPWRFGQAAQELASRGVPVVGLPPTDARMTPRATASIERSRR